MSSNAPKTAPKTAPKYWAESGEPPAEWKDHWHKQRGLDTSLDVRGGEKRIH